VPPDFSVIAIIAAYNEEDIIGQVVGHLIDQGVGVYLLDHGSTDDTAAEVKPYLGRGLLDVEIFPEGSGAPGETGQFAWESILRRKEALARELDANWFIHHDADEFRESPWAHLGLRDAIHRVDDLGYNAIDFELFDFRPTHDRFRRGDDVRQAFGFYEPGQPWDKLQVKCWKKLAPVDLVSSGGHDVAFEKRRVFPLRFILRHYPIRSQAHGERKIFRERRPRFVQAERAKGWHVQYDGIDENHRFIRDPVTLVAYDPDAARLRLCLEHRDVEELRRKLDAQEQAASASECSAETLRRDVEQLQQGLEDRDRQIGQLQGQLALRDRSLDARQGEIGDLRQEIDTRDRAVQAMETHLADLRREIAARDHAAQVMETHLADLGREIAARDHAAQVMETHLADLGREIAARDHAAQIMETHLADLRREIAARDHAAQVIETHLADLRREIDTHDRTLRTIDAVVEDLRHHARARDRDVQHLEERLVAAQREIEALASHLTEARHRVSALYASRSWRWMAPLRAAQRLFLGD
jgi:peptidoglycan hydrolase CwlO-like protein